MNTLSTRTKLMISLAVVLFVLFLFGESSRAQHFLWANDDNAMGIGLLPIVCFALPSGVLLLLSLVSYRADRRRVG
jgi:hypothetical protein